MSTRVLSVCCVLLTGCLSGEGIVSMGEELDAAPDLMAADLASPRDQPEDADRADLLDPADQADVGEPDDMDDLPDGVDLPPDPCDGKVCGAGASCVEGMCSCDVGMIGDPDVGCMLADPCSQTQCTAGAMCAAGVCRCSPGFAGDGTLCTAVSPGNTASRTRDAVCQRWRADYAPRAAQQWQVMPADDCDPGVLHPDVVEDALRRLTLYRWLVGLGPVSVSAGPQVNTQACATTLAASNRGLSHSLDASWTCYTDAARAGAGSSNIAQGVSRPADSVDLYVGDNGVTSLGHRRWVFNPPMGASGFGQRGSYSCMYSFDQSGGGSADYVAYPAPGFFPQDALRGVWSFSSGRYSISGSSTVEVRSVADNTALTVSNIYAPGGGYGQPTLAWSVAGVMPDVEYEVTIGGIGASGPVTYRTTIVRCP
jgi:hypothetical protein